MRFFRRLFCKHEFRFVRNIYGDEIFEWDLKRSIWQCVECGKLNVLNELHTRDSLPPSTSQMKGCE